MKKIAIIGSYNQDIVFRAHRIPSVGETLQGIGFFSDSGGKGSNQAIAAHLQGAQVTPVIKLGDDAYGQQARELYQRLGLPLTGLLCDPSEHTGVAGIFTELCGGNSIILSGGANLTLTADEIVAAVPETTELAGFQLENDPLVVFEAIRRLRQRGVEIMLDPAPVIPLPAWLYPYVSYLKPNEHEAAQLAGCSIHMPADALAAAQVLRERGAKAVVITLGVQGSVVCAEQSAFVPALKVNAIDTTAAGDVFSGAMLAMLALDQPLIEAVQYATCAAALSTTREGAWRSCPTAAETQTYFQAHRSSISPVLME